MVVGCEGLYTLQPGGTGQEQGQGLRGLAKSQVFLQGCPKRESWEGLPSNVLMPGLQRAGFAVAWLDL